jgi:hypothetical protein
MLEQGDHGDRIGGRDQGSTQHGRTPGQWGQRSHEAPDDDGRQDETGERQEEDRIQVPSQQRQIQLHRRRKDQGRQKEIQDDVRSESDEPNGLQEAERMRGERQQNTDDDQTDRVRKPDAPEHDRRNRRDQQKLQDPDD